LQNHYGPFDYRSPAVPESIGLVESYHFTPQVEQLRAGQSGLLAQDLAYTLRVFPNHPRALNSMARFNLDKMERKGNFGHFALSPECWFLRGIAFRPDDATVRMLFGNYLSKKGDRKAAREQYEAALAVAPDSAEVHYNFGLLLVDEGNLTQAAEHARKAYALGYPLPGLRNKLARAGVRID
jgi:tetratricopeptide (TPR) repeat protein